MAPPKTPATPERILQLETDAARILVAQIAEAGLAEDSELVGDMVEGSTSLMEAIEKVVASMVLEDEVQLEGLKKYATYLSDRKKGIEQRIERKKAMLMTAMQISERRTVKTSLKTISLKVVPPKVTITDESLLPAKYWKAADPTLDRAGVGDYLKTRAEAIEAVAKIEDPDGRTAALAALEEAMPPLPGAELSNGGETIAFR